MLIPSKCFVYLKIDRDKGYSVNYHYILLSAQHHIQYSYKSKLMKKFKICSYTMLLHWVLEQQKKNRSFWLIWIEITCSNGDLKSWFHITYSRTNYVQMMIFISVTLLIILQLTMTLSQRVMWLLGGLWKLGSSMASQISLS